MLNFRCDQCNQKMSVSEVHAGRKVRCKGCKSVVVVPGMQKIQIRKTPAATHPPLQLQSENDEQTVDSVNLKSETNLQMHSIDAADHTTVSCVNCAKEYKVASSNLGKKFTCTDCGSEFSAGEPKIENTDQSANVITFNCVMCQQQLKAPDSMQGKTVTCPHCKCFAEVPGAIVKSNISAESDQYSLVEVSKDCPYCGEEIRENAKKCKHCGEFIEAAAIENYRSGYGVNTPSRESYGGARSLRNEQSEKPPLGGGWVAVGWIGVVFLPLLGFIMGIICCCKKRVGNGVPMIILSILSFIALFILGFMAAIAEILMEEGYY